MRADVLAHRRAFAAFPRLEISFCQQMHRLDVSSGVAAAASDLLVSERSCKSLALVLGGGGAMSGRPAAETLRAAASAVAVLARISDLSAPDLATGICSSYCKPCDGAPCSYDDELAPFADLIRELP